MKKLFLPLVLLLGIAFTACQKEQILQEPTPAPVAATLADSDNEVLFGHNSVTLYGYGGSPIHSVDVQVYYSNGGKYYIPEHLEAYAARGYASLHSDDIICDDQNCYHDDCGDWIMNQRAECYFHRGGILRVGLKSPIYMGEEPLVGYVKFDDGTLTGTLPVIIRGW